MILTDPIDAKLSGEAISIWTMCDTDWSGRQAQERLAAQNIARWISQGAADPNEKAGQSSALRQACVEGSVFIVGALLDGGANPDVQDGDGETPLHNPATRRSLALVARLIAAGANPTIRSQTGQTALDSAEDWDTSEEVFHLLRTATAHRLAMDALHDIEAPPTNLAKKRPA